MFSTKVSLDSLRSPFSLSFLSSMFVFTGVECSVANKLLTSKKLSKIWTAQTDVTNYKIYLYNGKYTRSINKTMYTEIFACATTQKQTFVVTTPHKLRGRWKAISPICHVKKYLECMEQIWLVSISGRSLWRRRRSSLRSHAAYRQVAVRIGQVDCGYERVGQRVVGDACLFQGGHHPLKRHRFFDRVEDLKLGYDVGIRLVAVLELVEGEGDGLIANFFGGQAWRVFLVAGRGQVGYYGCDIIFIIPPAVDWYWPVFHPFTRFLICKRKGVTVLKGPKLMDFQ